MYCHQCGRDNRTGAAFCDCCGASLAGASAASVVFVGRRDELRVLHEALSQARTGSGGLLLVGGEPGIGKSRLGQEGAIRAGNLGFQVLWGRCLEDASAPPYWPWLQLMRGWLQVVEDGPLADATNGDAGLLLDLLPELGHRLPDVTPPAPLSAPSEARFRLFEAVVRVWQRIARQQPLLLVLDNLHAADSVSLRLLEFLAPELRVSPLLVLGTYRDIELSREHPFARTLGQLVRLPQCQRVSLSGLNRAETGRLLRNLADQRPLPAGLADAIHTHSEGNPLFIRELAQSLSLQGLLRANGHQSPDKLHVPIPEGIREVLRQRLGRLSAGCSDLLTIAAVIGRAFELELLVGLTGDLSITTVLDTLDEALAARLIEALAQPGRYQFTHALIRETLYEELPATRRLQLHHRIGEQLVTMHGEDASEHLPQLAYHFGQAAPLGTAVQAMSYAAKAGARAVKLLAYEEAVRFFSLALELQTRYAQSDASGSCRLLLALGTAQYKAGEYLEAMQSFRSAAVNARDRGDGEDLAHAALGYEEANWRPGLPGGTACQLLRDAVSAIDAGDSALRARLLSALTRALIFTGDVHQSAQVQAKAVAVARRMGEPALLAGALRAGLSARWRPEHLHARLAAAREVAALAKQAGDWDMLFEGLSWQLFDLLEAADMPAVHTTLEYHSQLAEELRQPFYRYIGVSLRAVLSLSEGQFDTSERYAREALALGQRQGLDAFGVFGLQMFSIERERGRLGQVAPLLERFLGDARSGGVWKPGLALLYSELERPEQARAELETLAADDFAAVPRDGLWVTCLAYLTEVCAALGDAEHAGSLYRHLLPYSGRNVVAGTTVACYGAADRFLGLLAGTRGEAQAAVRHFEAALELDGQTGARTWLAHTRYDYAALRLAGGETHDPVAAARLLDESRTIANALGMAGLCRKIEALARRAGLYANTQAAPAGLSRRELDVLRLLAAGQSNRNIATRLFVSPNTVANHVRNILAKTGTSNRTEAAAFARQRGLVEV